MPRGIPNSGPKVAKPVANVLALMQAAADALNAVPADLRQHVLASVIERKRRGRKPGRKPGPKPQAKAQKVKVTAPAKAKVSKAKAKGNGAAAATPSTTERKKQRAAEILSEGT